MKLQNRLIPHDHEVADAKKKPIFNELFNNNIQNIENINNINNFTKVKDNDNIRNNNINENTYINLPTDKFNEINFKSVLEKNTQWNN